jgi:ribonuclease Z
MVDLVSCNVVRIPGAGNIILDCGEGASASLRRHFTSAQYKEFITNIRTIYVSHLHADHHLGILSIIKEFTKFQRSLPSDQRQPVFLVAPWRLFGSLYEYNQVEDIGLGEYVIPFSSYDLIPPYLIPPGNISHPLDTGLFQGFLSAMDLKSFETCFVPHCPQAYGVAITHNSGWKIVYSGDCRPSGDLVEIGRDATLCIHEATVAETQPQEALDKMHCTTGEAIMIGKRMNSKHILLTHFSQKWSRVPEFVIDWDRHKEDGEKYENVGIAFDHMTVKIGDMWKLPMMLSAYQVIYGDERTRNNWIKMQNSKEECSKAKRELEEKTEPSLKRVHLQSAEPVDLAVGNAEP